MTCTNQFRKPISLRFLLHFFNTKHPIILTKYRIWRVVTKPKASESTPKESHAVPGIRGRVRIKFRFI